MYFTNRSVTPFMSTMSRKIGEITLRDFKVLFDRPGFYRFHFKSVDQEFGMVKEEVRSQLYNCILGNVLKFYFSDFLWWHGFARIWWQNCSMGRRRLKCLKSNRSFNNQIGKWHYEDKNEHGTHTKLYFISPLWYTWNQLFLCV